MAEIVKLDQSAIQKLVGRIDSLESKVKELQGAVACLESENKELLQKVKI